MADVSSIISGAQSMASSTQSAAASMIGTAMSLANSSFTLSVEYGDVGVSNGGGGLIYPSGSGSTSGVNSAGFDVTATYDSVADRILTGVGSSSAASGITSDGGLSVLDDMPTLPDISVTDYISDTAYDSLATDITVIDDPVVDTLFDVDTSPVHTVIDLNPVSPPTSGATAPGAFAGAFYAPVSSETLTLLDIVLPEDITVPDAPAEMDTSTLFGTDKPTAFVMPALTTPTLATFDAPTAPAINAPYLEEGTSDALQAPTIITPDFTATFDGEEPTTPTAVATDFRTDFANTAPQILAMAENAADNYIARYCPQYNAAMASLESKIAECLNGGTVLGDTIEGQIYGRGQSRILSERFANEREMDSNLAKKGFTIPPGIRQAIIKELLSQATKAMSAFAAETAIERAKLEINHLQFCLNLTANVRQSVMQAVIQVQGNMIAMVGQAIDFARQVGVFTVEVFNASVRLYEAKMALYRARAEVYRTELEAAFAQMKVFEAQIQAEKLNVDLDRNRIEVYQARMQAEELKIRIYLGQLEGVKALSDLERNKLEVFKAEIEGYSLQVKAKEAEFGAYRASIEGDKARVEANGLLIDGYNARLQGARIKIESGQMKSNVIIQHNRSLVEKFEAGLNQVRLRLEAEGKRYDSERDAYQAALELYKAELQDDAEQAKIYLSANDQTMRKQIAAAELILTGRDQEIRMDTAIGDMTLKGRDQALRAQIAKAEVSVSERDQSLRRDVAAGEFAISARDQNLRQSIARSEIAMNEKDSDLRRETAIADVTLRERDQDRQAYRDYADTVVKENDLDLRREIAGSDLGIKAGDLDLRKNIATAENRTRLLIAKAGILESSNTIRAQIAMAGADAYGQMASSAMSAVNGIAQQYIDETA